MATSKSGFSFAHAHSRALSWASAAPRPSFSASKVSVFWSNFSSLTSGWLLVKKASAVVPLLTSRVWSFSCATSVIGLPLGETTPNATFI
ncbi:Uncharacterised protein [Mycobacteroides abscessus subsp. massiliense]|nr:Uncharacterised protein [Mycobacteroides abscessus subsp. massiliense]